MACCCGGGAISATEDEALHQTTKRKTN